MVKKPNKQIEEPQEEQASTLSLSLLEDNREPIVLEGDSNNAFLPRFDLTPYSGKGSGLSHKS